MKLTEGQLNVKIAFGDAITGERTKFLNQGVDRMEEVINSIVLSAFDSVNDMDMNDPEAVALLAHLQEEMKESTRRGLGRAIKRMAKICSEAAE